MTDKPVSDYLNRPLRDLCAHCRDAIASEETGLCRRCYWLAQADVDDSIVDLDERRDFAKWGG